LGVDSDLRAEGDRNRAGRLLPRAHREMLWALGLGAGTGGDHTRRADGLERSAVGGRIGRALRGRAEVCGANGEFTRALGCHFRTFGRVHHSGTRSRNHRASSGFERAISRLARWAKRGSGRANRGFRRASGRGAWAERRSLRASRELSDAVGDFSGALRRGWRANGRQFGWALGFLHWANGRQIRWADGCLRWALRFALGASRRLLRANRDDGCALSRLFRAHGDLATADRDHGFGHAGRGLDRTRRHHRRALGLSDGALRQLFRAGRDHGLARCGADGWRRCNANRRLGRTGGLIDWASSRRLGKDRRAD
jgi:hypothetical protein